MFLRVIRWTLPLLALAVILPSLTFLVSAALPPSTVLSYTARRGLMLYDMGYHVQIALYQSADLSPGFAWSPDGQRVAVWTLADGLRIADQAGQPTRTIDQFGIPLAWSPDGDQLAFLPLATSEPELYILDAAGTLLDQIKGLTGFPEVVWLGDGGRISYLVNEAGVVNIAMTDLTTRQMDYLTDNRVDEENLALSPDGTRLAFVSYLNANADIFVLDLDSGELPRSITTSFAYEAMPTWSPDGTQIAYVSANRGFSNIYVTDLNTRTRTAVTQQSNWVTRPIWSPDGRYIAYLMGEVGSRLAELMVTDMHTGGQISIDEGVVWNTVKAWQPRP